MDNDGKHKRRGGKCRQRTKQRTSAPLRDAPRVPLHRQRQPIINHEKMEAYLAAATKLADDINHDRADLRKSGSNLQEIVHLLNTGTDPASILNLIESAVLQFRAATARANESLDDLKELKTIAKEALGLRAEPQSS
jgi:hypothetical protein